jgi:LysR family transcriptional regulator, hydrogen peroxide-inducible genes activator
MARRFATSPLDAAAPARRQRTLRARSALVLAELHRMDLSQVTLSQMRYAIAVHAKGSFGAAAASCAVSQSGLSMQLQKLEELLGVVLFDRSKKPVLLTQEGAPALAQMRTVLREMERLGQVVAEELEPAGVFRLAVIPTLAPSVLPLFLSAFVAACPRVELRIEELQTAELVDRLQADTLDAGIAATPLAVAGLAETQVGLEALLAYLAPDDTLLAAASIQQHDLTSRELWVMPEGHCFRTQVLSYCASARAVNVVKRPRIHFESASFETLIRLVDAGLGATILPALVANQLPPLRRQAQLRPFAGPVPMREISLVTSRQALRKRVTDAMVEVLRATLSVALGAAPEDAVLLDPLLRQ